jgi:hypothetical protein
VAGTTLPAADDTDDNMSSSAGRDRTLLDMFTTACWSFDRTITMGSQGVCNLKSLLSRLRQVRPGGHCCQMTACLQTDVDNSKLREQESEVWRFRQE